MDRKSHYLNADGPDQEAVKNGILWLIEKSKEYGGGFLLIPVTSNLEGIVEDIVGREIVSKLRKNGSVVINGANITLVTEKKMIYRANNRSVLSLYGGKKILDKIDSVQDISEILVFPWMMDEIKNWIKTWNATELGQPQPTTLELVSNPVVVKALESLTASVNLSTGISHPLDRSRTIWTFKFLKEYNESYNPDEIKSWLISKGKWRATAAQEAMEIAQGVLEEKAYHAGEPAWVNNIVEIWRKDAGVTRDDRKEIENQDLSLTIPRIPVSSSNLSSVGYDGNKKILDVEFHNGNVYRYFDVPKEEHVRLMSADSHGTYFSRNIKSNYKYRRIR